MDKIEIGRMSEDAAVYYLQNMGYKIRERNFRCSLGEIDIIADDHNVLVFVEVRSKGSSKFGLPQETVNWVKQKKLRRLATYYIKINNLWNRECRFDVVGILYSVDYNNDTKLIESIELIKDAF